MLTNRELATQFFQAPAYYIPTPVQASASANQPVKGITVNTSPWWIDRLVTAMGRREERLLRLRAYYRGEQDTWRLSSDSFKTTFGRAFYGMKANLPKMIVDSAVHRMEVTGFSLKDTNDPDSKTDPEAWRIWQANNLDSLAVVAFAEALALGECSMLVAPDPKDPKTPRITVEDPLQVIVDRDPANPQSRRAALKRFVDDDGLTVHILFLPDRVEWWRAKVTSSPGGEGWGWVAPYVPDGMAFQLRGIHYELDRTKSTAPAVPGEIPVVPLVSSPRIDGAGQSDFEAVIPLVDAYNKTLMDVLVTAEYFAAPWRTATGVSLEDEAPELDADGNVVVEGGSSIKVDKDRILAVENPDAKFGEFPASDLSAFQTMFGEITTKIGAITFTPYHYLAPAPTSVPPTGESLKSAETPLVSRVKRHSIDIGEGLEEVMRIAFLTVGDTARAESDAEVGWANPEARLISVLGNALVQLATVGVPEEALWAEWGFSPQEISQFKAMKAASPPPQQPIRVTEALGGPGAPLPGVPAKPAIPATVPTAAAA